MPYLLSAFVALNLKMRYYKIMFYVFPSRGKFKTLSWDLLSQHQHLSPANQSIFDEIINGEIFLRYQLSTYTMVS